MAPRPQRTLPHTIPPPAREEKPRRRPANTLNDLAGKDWIKFTKSWLICDSRRYLRNKDTELHPARYPEELINEFIGFFTKAGQRVLDPFCGSGATLVSCHETGRAGVGVELSGRYVKVTQARLEGLGAAEQTVLQGDATRLAETVEGPFDFVITSPPYFNMLRKSRGGVESAQKKRAKAGLDTVYSEDGRDLGNLHDYEQYIETMGQVFDQAAEVLAPGKYLVVIVQNLRDVDGQVRPLAFDLTRRLSQTLSFQGERIWCQNSKPLGIWGYPSVFVPNYHHHYCLIFRKGKA